jgi:hypothetical protein
MPFNIVTTLPPASPSLTVFFRGLLILSPNADGTCSVGVHYKSAGHALWIDVDVVDLTDPQNPIRTNLFSVPGPLKVRDFLIEVDPPTNNGVTKYVPTVTDDQDFSLVLDPAGPVFHNQTLTLDPTGTKYGIHLTEGVLHTARRTKESDVTIKRVWGNKPDLDLHSIASLVGANIYLDNGSSVVLSWDQRGTQTVPLPKPPSNFKYEVVVYNDPDPPNPNPHSEFKEYYKVLRKSSGAQFPPGEQFDLDITPHTLAHGALLKFTPFASDRIPCMAVNNGG